MIARLLLAGFLLALAGAAPVPPAPFRTLDVRRPDARVTGGGLVVTNAAAPCRPDAPAGDDPCIAVRIAGPGRAPFTLRGTQGSNARVGIGPLVRGGAPAVMLVTFTGGAHCCERYDVALPDARGWRRLTVTRTETTDRGPRRQTDFNYGLTGFPVDRDGDGRADLVMGDDAFAYAFTDYADSRTPPVVLNIVGGRTVDVSRRASFAPLFRADMASARRGCIASGGGRNPNGACAAYAADAARLGRFAAAWREVLAHYDRGQDGTGAYPRCTADYVAGKCPAGHAVSYPDFPSALRDLLRRDGYLAA